MISKATWEKNLVVLKIPALFTSRALDDLSIYNLLGWVPVTIQPDLVTNNEDKVACGRCMVLRSTVSQHETATLRLGVH